MKKLKKCDILRYNGRPIYQHVENRYLAFINIFFVGRNSKIEEFDQYGEHLGSFSPNGDPIPDSKNNKKKLNLK